MKLKSGFESKKARVEMLPLIDVVFLLLVFFIYAFVSMVIHKGIGVELPAASSATADRNDYLAISITADNEIFVNKLPVSRENIADTVRAARSSDDQPVFINGDKQADLGLAVRILDQLRLAGIEKVSFTCTDESNN